MTGFDRKLVRIAHPGAAIGIPVRESVLIERKSHFAAFAGLEKIIAQRSQKSSIGFGAHVSGPDERRTGDILRQIEPEDLLKFGLIPEFVGGDRNAGRSG